MDCIGMGRGWGFVRQNRYTPKACGIADSHSDPDVGVDEDIAQFYFLQLLDAMVCEDSSRLLMARNSVTAKESLIEVII
jgi:hypothetical protein